MNPTNQPSTMGRRPARSRRDEGTAMLIARLAHVALRSSDPEGLAEFYGALFGLAEIARNGDTHYLATGTTPGYQLEIGIGDPGVEHFALSVGDRTTLDEARSRLTELGTEIEPLVPSPATGIDDGWCFALPSGHVMALVSQADPVPFHAVPLIDARHLRGVGPVKLEHITMNCGDVERVATFLIETLGLRLTESVQPPGAPWFNAFLRCRDRHHDVAFFAGEDGDTPRLNHLCFAVPSVIEVVRVCDLVAGRGIVLDASIGRHINGNNVFVYFKDPDGNRIEVNTDMAEIDPASEPRIWDSMRFDAWRDGIPSRVLSASRCRDGRRQAGAPRR